MTEHGNPPELAASGAPASTPGRHAAYQDLPEVTEIAQQLRQIQALSKQFEVHLGDALGCNPTDLAAMQHLIDEGPMSPTVLAQRLGITSAAATMVVDRLVGLGHVERRGHETDRRRIVVVPAPDSIAAAVRVLLPVIEGVDQLISSMTQTERDIVRRFLAGVITIYGDAVADSPARMG